jgi:hypothetical protein
MTTEQIDFTCGERISQPRMYATGNNIYVTMGDRRLKLERPPHEKKTWTLAWYVRKEIKHLNNTRIEWERDPHGVVYPKFDTRLDAARYANTEILPDVWKAHLPTLLRRHITSAQEQIDELNEDIVAFSTLLGQLEVSASDVPLTPFYEK